MTRETGRIARRAGRARAAGARVAIQIRAARRAVGESEAGVLADLHARGARGQAAVARGSRSAHRSRDAGDARASVADLVETARGTVRQAAAGDTRRRPAGAGDGPLPTRLFGRAAARAAGAHADTRARGADV